MVKINDKSQGMYNEFNQIKFNSSILGSSLCDYSNTYKVFNAYILSKGTITVAKKTDVAPKNANKNLTFKNCGSFTNCVSRVNNSQVDDAHDIDLIVPVYEIIKHNDKYWETSGILWKYCID